MGRRAPIFGLTMWMLLGLMVCGCLSDKARLLQNFESSPAAALQEPEAPRVSRLQTSAPPPPIQPLSSPEPGGPQTPLAFQGKVRAWVNGQPIFDAEIHEAILPINVKIDYSGLPEAERTRQKAEVFKSFLDQLIDYELLYQDAIHKLQPKPLKSLKEFAKKEFDKKIRILKEKNHLSDDEFKDKLRQQGSTLENMERMEERKFIADENLHFGISPCFKNIGHLQIRQYYDDHLNEFQKVDSVKWQDIFIAIAPPRNPTREQARQFAESIVARLRSGEDFAQFLAFDDGNSKFNGGQGAGHRRGDIQPREVEEHLFQLKDGEVGPLVEISTGFHVIRLVQREYAGQIPFNEEVQKIVLVRLKNQIYERETKSILQNLRKRAVIEIEND